MYYISYTYKKRAFWLLRIAVVFAAGYYLYVHLSRADRELWDAGSFASFSSVQMGFIVLLLVLWSGVNWYLEGVKWNVLIRDIHPERVMQSLKISLIAHVFSMLTPAKTGEFGGKLLYYPAGVRKQAATRIALGNLWQLAVTYTFGVLGFVYLYVRFGAFLPARVVSRLYYFFLVLLLLFVLAAVFNRRFGWWGWLKKAKYHVGVSVHRKVAALSLLRYVVFAHQYYFLLKIMEFPVDYLTGMSMIAMVYVLASMLPVINIFDVLVKGSVALLVFSLVEELEAKILLVSTIMWICNFLLPVLPGVVFLFVQKTNFRRQKVPV